MAVKLLLAILFVPMVASSGQRNITAKHGENVTLPCGDAEIKHVVVVKWSIPHLEPDYILLYRDEQFDHDYQSEFFKNRVHLKDVDRGDPSLSLNNVTANDAGTYTCQVVYKDGNEKRKELTSTINVTVEPGNKDGGQDGKAKADEGNNTGLIVGLVVVALGVAAVVFAVYKYRKRQRSLTPDANPPAEEL